MKWCKALHFRDVTL